MRINSDDIIFDAVITKAAKENIDLLNDYGEDDPFTKTPEFKKMMDEVYVSVKKNIKKSTRKKNFVRRVVVIAAALTLVFVMVALNASALNMFFYRAYMDVRGDLLNVKSDAEGMREQYAAISKFKLKDKLLVPGWLPKGTELVDVVDSANVVFLEYEYNSAGISFTQKILPDDLESRTNQYFLERSDYRLIENYVNGISVYLLKVEGDIGKTLYSAVWRDDSMVYTIDVTGSEVMLKSIIELLEPMY